MSDIDRRTTPGPDRRRVSRGGRRATDRPGCYPSVIVADSYARARIPCARYLGRYGFKVIQAATPGRAVRAVAAQEAQIILAEISPTPTPTARLTERLAADARARRIPLIVMTTGFGDQVRDHAHYGAAGVLLKPFRLTRMLDEVRRVLRASQEEAARQPAYQKPPFR